MINNEIIEILKKKCPSPHHPDHPFFEVLIPEEYGGNGEDVITFKRISIDRGSEALPFVDWEAYSYPGFQMLGEEDQNNHRKWKGQQ